MHNIIKGELVNEKFNETNNNIGNCNVLGMSSIVFGQKEFINVNGKKEESIKK